MVSESSGLIGVIGGGLGGLAAACTLSARGHRVILFERNGWAGGKAAVHTDQGYRFDMGPTILTLPSVLRRIFQEAGRDVADYLDLIELDPQWRCLFEDGTCLDLVADDERMAESVSQFTADQRMGEGYRKFLAISRRLHEVSDRFFFWKSVGSVADTFDAGTTFQWSVLGDLWNLRFGRSVAGTVRACVPDDRVAQMLDHFTQYVGSSPFLAPAVLCGIAHMQTGERVWYPQGGTAMVPQALVKLAREHNVEIRLNSRVRRIVLDNGRVAGIETESGERVKLDAVVSNCDVVRTHRELLDLDTARPFLNRKSYEPACSGVVLYLGLKRRYDHLLHHNFVFSRDAEQEFEAIYTHGQPAPDPTCYVAAPAATDPSVAPEGCEALYVLVHAPYLHTGQDWNHLFAGYRNVILDKLETTGGMTDLRQQIVVEHHLTPQDIHDRYHVLQGAIYGLASHGRFNGAFKPPNRSTDVPGLYLAGGSAHPGPGMPMAMMSGWIAADALDHDRPVPAVV